MAGSSQSEGEATPLQASSRCLACYPTSKAEPSDPTEEFILAACIHNLILSVTTMSSWPQVGIGVDLDLIVNPKHHHPAKILLQSPPWWPDTPLAPPSHRLKTLYNMPELGDLGEQPRGGHLFFYHLEVNDHLWSYRTHFRTLWALCLSVIVSLANNNITKGWVRSPDPGLSIKLSKRKSLSKKRGSVSWNWNIVLKLRSYVPKTNLNLNLN